MKRPVNYTRGVETTDTILQRMRMMELINRAVGRVRKAPKKYNRAEQAGSRAAQRRLKQILKGQLKP